MWSIKNLFLQQNRTAPKRQKVGDQIYLTSAPDEMSLTTSPRDPHRGCLPQASLDIRIAGCEATDSPPAAEETVLTKSCDYVKFGLRLPPPCLSPGGATAGGARVG